MIIKIREDKTVLYFKVSIGYIPINLITIYHTKFCACIIPTGDKEVIIIKIREDKTVLFLIYPVKISNISR